MKKAKTPAPAEKPQRTSRIRTLAVDIGGTGIKAILLDQRGQPISDRKRIATPRKATPGAVIKVICRLARELGPFDRATAGFPGVIKAGTVYSAPNLGKGWKGYELERELHGRLDAPVRVANDADVQGLAAVSGHGLELVITLGTGFGSVLFANGVRVHMELGHHPFHKGKTYEDELGVKALKRKGRRKWNKLLAEALRDLKTTFNYDHLYIGGGDAKYIDFKLPADVTVISNEDGLLGGIRLWSETPAQDAGGAARLRAALSRDGVHPAPKGRAAAAATPPAPATA